MSQNIGDLQSMQNPFQEINDNPVFNLIRDKNHFQLTKKEQERRR